MRRTSVSLPTKQVAHDPHEKLARHRPQEVEIFSGLKAVWMSQAQKTRWVKTAAIIFALVTLFYWLSPKGVDIYNEGAFVCREPVARHRGACILTRVQSPTRPAPRPKGRAKSPLTLRTEPTSARSPAPSRNPSFNMY